MDGGIIMPGGNKNIRPEDGKQFQPGDKAAEKWTEKKALELGDQLLDWQKEVDEDDKDKGHIFWEEFFVIENDYYPELPSYLSNKFSSFLKLIERAKKIQEIKLVKYGVADRLNASMTKFCLINHHGYYDKQLIDHSNKGEKFDFNNVSTNELVDRLNRLMDSGKED